MRHQLQEEILEPRTWNRLGNQRNPQDNLERQGRRNIAGKRRWNRWRTPDRFSIVVVSATKACTTPTTHTLTKPRRTKNWEKLKIVSTVREWIPQRTCQARDQYHNLPPSKLIRETCPLPAEANHWTVCTPWLTFLSYCMTIWIPRSSRGTESAWDYHMSDSGHEKSSLVQILSLRIHFFLGHNMSPSFFQRSHASGLPVSWLYIGWVRITWIVRDGYKFLWVRSQIADLIFFFRSRSRVWSCEAELDPQSATHD